MFSRRNMIGLGAIFFASVFFVSSVAATNADFSDTASGTIRITVMIPDDPPTAQDDPTPTPSPCPAPSEPPALQPVSNPSQTPVPTQPEGPVVERQANEGQTVSP